MIIGVPKEIKDNENRVALTPSIVSSLISHGNRVLIQNSAGNMSGFSDSEYDSAGAIIVPSAEDIYSQSDLIVKVKEIQISKGEHKHIQPTNIVFGYNHFESSKELTDAALKSRATFVSFEKVVDSSGRTPLLMPMSKIAGTVAGVWAGFFYNYAFRHDKLVRLKTGSDEVKAKFISEFEKIISFNFDPHLKRLLSLSDKTVMVFGGGNVGEMAARICSVLGSKVIIVEKNQTRMKYLEELNLAKTSVISSADSDTLKAASVIIGATYDKEKADRLIDEKMLKSISEVRKKIFIDVSIDQGGNFPYIDTSGKYSPHSTGTILNPAQADYFGNIFIRVPNIPSIVPRYASKALSSAIIEYVISITKGLDKPELNRAISIKNGKIIDDAILRAHR